MVCCFAWQGLAAVAQAETIRCGNRLVGVNDRRYEVLAACGEPDLVMPARLELIPFHALLPYEEIWYYNLGPRELIRQLRFRQGRLVAINFAGYGFSPGYPGLCRPEDLRRGMTHLELVARCGQPADRVQRVRWLMFDPFHPLGPGRMALEEEWLYDFGPDRLYRVLILVDGLVVRIETGGPGFRR
jgi:hypothetical protein